MSATIMELKAVDPAYLEAKTDTDAARTAHRRAKARAEIMESKNVKHAEEVARNSDGRLATNGQILRFGSGSGFDVIYSRCRCDGVEQECTHDPREAPYSAADLKAAGKAIGKAEKALEAAETNLAATPHALDAFTNARDNGAEYVWWPLVKFVDPRRQRWQGQPVTTEELAALGPHGLRHGIADGSIIEVT